MNSSSSPVEKTFGLGGTRASILPAAAERHSSTLSDISRKTNIELVLNPDWNCSAFNKNIDHNYLQILDIVYIYYNNKNLEVYII